MIEVGKTDSGGYRHIIYTLDDGSHLIREFLSYDNLIKTSRDYIYATITKPDGTSTHHGLKESYDSIFNWLKENNYYEDFTISPDDIKHVVLENTRRSPDQEQNQVEIRDPQVIEEILSLLRHQDDRAVGEYVFVGLYQDERHPYFQDRLLIDNNIQLNLKVI